ncbi:acetamidase/formamidase family protein [Knoellia sp. Soil729]|uniref:acetamidase/formamidase family protein n=1 Tax=Knoellia sp. Soil729 TaxID=1736394 RepID=UPI0006F845E4|nr:acetamidase/formamidase family protein [Knoellia sp. Soil729]KRE40260.1 acetamidase/formamidase [Knoellia sp. Soil729]
MTDYFLGKEHGKAGFARDITPALTIRPGTGERITFQTDDAAHKQMEEFRDLGRITATRNPVTGPVFVEDAGPGDALAVTIHDITLGPQGWSIYIPGAGALAGRMGEEWYVRQVPIQNGTVQLADGVSTPVAPMIGCIGVAPSEGIRSTLMPSYPTGGNMDLTDARPGSTVYLPVEVHGALLAIGDLHAVMSRGESSFVAIEVAGTATVSVDVVKGLSLRAPRIDTGNELVCVGLGEQVQDSVIMAYESLFDVLVTEHCFSREDAYTVLSAVGHTELGGPAGSREPDPLHPLRAVGAVTVARIEKKYLLPRK